MANAKLISQHNEMLSQGELQPLAVQFRRQDRRYLLDRRYAGDQNLVKQRGSARQSKIGWLDDMEIKGKIRLERYPDQRIAKGNRRQRIDDRNAKAASGQGTGGKGWLAFDRDLGPAVRLVKDADHMLAGCRFASERDHPDAVEILGRQDLPLCERVGWLHHTDASRPERCRHLDILPHSERDRKSTRLNSSHVAISYAVFC